MEFLCLLLASILFDVIFFGVCGFPGLTILDAVRSERDRSAVVDKAVDRTQQGALKQADNDARGAALIGLVFWCLVGAGGLSAVYHLMRQDGPACGLDVCALRAAA